MNEEEHSANDKTQGVSDREKELQRLQKRKSELVGEISQIGKVSSESVGTLNEYTEKIIAERARLFSSLLYSQNLSFRGWFKGDNAK